MKSIQIELSDKGRNAVRRFNLLTKTEIGKSFLISFNEEDDTITLNYDIKKTIWDNKEKDFCIDLMMFDRSNSNFYIYPQANEVYISLIDAKKYFNILVKEIFNIDIDISKKTLDRLFQSLKLTGDRKERSRYIKECIQSSIISKSGTNLGKLLNRDLSKESITLLELDCLIFEFKFTQNLINFIELINQIFSNIEDKPILEGLIKSNILIHKNLSDFFQTELWKKIKNIFGVYDKQFIESGNISGLIPELSMNVLFLPVIQEYLNSGLLTLEQLDNRYFELSNNQIVLAKRDYCFKEDREILDSMLKVLNLVELLPVYEASVIQILPNLSLEEFESSNYIDYFNYKNSPLITLVELNKVKKIYSKEDNLILDKELTLDNDSDSNNILIDSSLYILPRKLSDLMITIFNKYFI